jgi:hypothetical protein
MDRIFCSCHAGKFSCLTALYTVYSVHSVTILSYIICGRSCFCRNWDGGDLSNLRATGGRGQSDQRSRMLEPVTVCGLLKNKFLVLPSRPQLRTSGPQLRRGSSSSKRGISSFSAVCGTFFCLYLDPLTRLNPVPCHWFSFLILADAVEMTLEQTRTTFLFTTH